MRAPSVVTVAVLALAVLAGATAAAARAQAPAEPPPSPPREATAPAPAPPIEPPTVGPVPTATPTRTPTPIPASTPTSTSTSTTTTTTTIPPGTPIPPATTTLAEPRAAAPEPAYQAYAPPGMTWGAPPPASAGAADPSVASSSYRGVEWGLGALATEGGGMVEGTLLADFGTLALGMVAVVGGRNEHAGAGLLLAGGPRFRLADGIRLDGQLDAGLVFFGSDTRDASLSSERTSGSDAVLPAIGARLGVTFTSAASGWYVSVGAGVRHVPRTTVEYTTTRCGFLGFCTETKGSATYGGTIAGGYLTFGQGARRGR